MSATKETQEKGDTNIQWVNYKTRVSSKKKKKKRIGRRKEGRMLHIAHPSSLNFIPFKFNNKP